MGSQNIVDLRYYDGLDRYSEGETEEMILKRLEQGESELEILRKEEDWPYIYHFSPVRRNLLSWYPFNPGASILEIGAGCGALTGLFLERGLNVTAVELSQRRSRINYLRNKKYDDWRIFVGNIDDMHFDAPFDYATLVGVLEYAGQYGQGEEPYISMLNNVEKRLAPGGMLFLAIENPLGMKYFAGAAEDHAGRPFVSIEGYSEAVRSDEPGHTFDKDSLKAMIMRAGFESCEFYFVMPDYKLPECVVHEDEEDLFSLCCLPSQNFEKGAWRSFDERRALQNAVSMKKFDLFCNSFLVLARKGCEA